MAGRQSVLKPPSSATPVIALDAGTWSRWDGDALELTLRVKPRAPKDAFIGAEGTHYRVAIKAPPVEGKGNTALRKFIADAFGVAPSKVSVIGGEHSRYKRLRIQAPRTFPIPVEPRSQ